MRDMSYFTKLDPIDYEEIASDCTKHLYFRDYKSLKDVDFDYPVHEPMWVKITATMGLIACFIVILFIA